MDEPSLFSEEAQPVRQPEFGSVLVFRISQIHPSPAQPRLPIRHDDPDFQRLVESVRVHGVLQPILVRRAGTGIELIAGHRRMEACKVLGVDTIAAFMIDSPAEASALAAFVDNDVRTNLTYWERAQAVGRLRDDLASAGRRFTQGELAKLLSYSEPSVSQFLKIFDRFPATLWRDGAGATEAEMSALSGEHLRAIAVLDEPIRAERLRVVIGEMRRTADRDRVGDGRTVSSRRYREHPAFARQWHRDGAESVRVNPEHLDSAERRDAIATLEDLLRRVRDVAV